jgi:hypothetical protein
VAIWYIFPFWYVVPRKIWQPCLKVFLILIQKNSGSQIFSWRPFRGIIYFYFRVLRKALRSIFLPGKNSCIRNPFANENSAENQKQVQE